ASLADTAGTLCAQVQEGARRLATTEHPRADAVRALRKREDRLTTAYLKALKATEETERMARAIAQLAFGVSARLSTRDLVERLDPPPLAVLPPPPAA